MNETRERFLRAILERIPAERIAEIHFLPSIRQGQMETGVAVIAAEPEFEQPVAGRHEVLSAAYRWTRKGPDRGKWEVDVTAEADAPLPTVDIVVRGVQERAGEALEPQRLTASELRALLSEPAWQSSPS
ncbi:MAG: hypothetical protein ACHQQ3_12595 [Gemmatimonadales bacterium]